MSRPPLTSRDWFGKAAAATILGFTLTMALTCIFATLSATDDDVFSAQRQLAMWLASPIWCAILGLCFLFRRSARAWAWLTLANLLAWARGRGSRRSHPSSRCISAALVVRPCASPIFCSVLPVPSCSTRAICSG